MIHYSESCRISSLRVSRYNTHICPTFCCFVQLLHILYVVLCNFLCQISEKFWNRSACAFHIFSEFFSAEVYWQFCATAYSLLYIPSCHILHCKLQTSYNIQYVLYRPFQYQIQTSLFELWRNVTITKALATSLYLTYPIFTVPISMMPNLFTCCRDSTEMLHGHCGYWGCQVSSTTIKQWQNKLCQELSEWIPLVYFLGAKSEKDTGHVSQSMILVSCKWYTVQYGRHALSNIDGCHIQIRVVAQCPMPHPT